MKSPFLLLILVALGFAGSTCGENGEIPGSVRRNLQGLSLTSESWIGELSGEPGEEFGECSMKPTFPPAAHTVETDDCNNEMSCVPILTLPSSDVRALGLERAGVCVDFPGGHGKEDAPSTAYVFDSLAEMPVPMGYFPLTFDSVDSWPFPAFKGKLDGQKFVKDEVFGSVLKCDKSTVRLPAIGYASRGAFSINFWMKRDGPGEGIGFEYVFSHMKDGASAGIRGDSQIQVYLPRDPLPAHGILRAAVKDSNDKDEGSASDTYLDSDGEVGNNSDRDFGDDHVDFYDGKWHMVTLTSRSSKGFRMYVDGALAGKMGKQVAKELQVTGGDPIDLTGEIHLCGRAVDSDDRYFEGSIAHLALFDTPLDSTQVKALFQSFFATKTQVDGGDSFFGEGKLTKEGNTCLFPTLHRGKWVTECVPLKESQECPTGPGVWEECNFFASEHEDNFQITDIGEKDDGFAYVTADGEKCEFPTFYSGKIYRECISIHGQPKCPTKNGIWKDCERAEKEKEKDGKSTTEDPKGPWGTIYGDQCVFPFEYRGESFDECTRVGGIWSCRIESGEFAPCAVVRNPETDYKVNPEAPVISRVTVGGKKCFFPYWYGEESVADCYLDHGVPSCPTEDDGIQPCAPLRLTMDGEPCAMPFFHNFNTYSNCVEVEGQEHCMTRDGEFKRCAPQGSEIHSTGTGEPHLRILPARPSVDGGNCEFPFWYKGKLVSECVEEGDSEYCRTLYGAWEECAPQRLTTEGKKCSIPFNTEDGESHYDCIQVGKTFQCPTASEEPWGECVGEFDLVPVPEPGAESEEDIEEEAETVVEDGEVEEKPAAAGDGTDSDPVEVEHSGALPEDGTHYRSTEKFPSESWLGELTAGNGELHGPCQLKTTFLGVAGKEGLPECSGDLSCVPVLATPGTTPELEGLERTGMCVDFPGPSGKTAGPPGAAYIFDPLKDMPIPMGYFPLVSGGMDSWPFPSYKGHLEKQKFVEDEVFGSVIQCKQGTVVLPSISYAGSGEFSISMWIKREKAGKGIGFEYIFSHMQKGASAGFRKDSQIQLYLPRDPLPSHGVLRAVVKDSNDVDEGQASESFLDSDGQVGNNFDRDFGDDHVDFYDGKWHMVTLTSKPDKSQGFNMYVDGALAGEMKPTKVDATDGNNQVELQVTGGDPIDLTGEIHLCGRAVDSDDRYFEGSIAHLALFDTPLSASQVKELFQSFFATKNQVDATVPTKNITLTKGGEACMFPSLYRGGWINNCVDKEGVKRCPSAPATWTACDSKNTSKEKKVFEDKTHRGNEDQVDSGSDFVTIDGEDCELPVYYEGNLHEGCVAIDGTPKCHAKGGKWKECRTKSGEKVSVEEEEQSEDDETKASKEIEDDEAKASKEDKLSKEEETNTGGDGGPFVTVDGEDCELPVYYKGVLHEGCVTIDGAPKCHAKGGEWKECKSKEGKKEKEGKKQEKKSASPTSDGDKAVSRDPQTNYNANPDAPLIGRVTTDGKKCYFPFWYGQESIGGCFLKDGVPSCPSGRDGVKPCAPLRLTVEGQPCSMPFTHRGKEHSDCVEIDGKEHCMTPGGELNECAPLVEEEAPEEDYKIVPARATVRNNNCAFPFWHQGRLVSDCVIQGEGEFCRTMLGKWEECAPQQLTIGGEKCSIPFEYEGEFRFECVEIEGVVQCPTSKEEPWGECARKESTEISSPRDSAARNESG